MFTPSDTLYTHSQPDERPRFSAWVIPIGLAAGLTLAASWIWSGLVLAGIGLLCLAFSLISSALYSQNAGYGARWRWVIAGQLAGISGIFTLFIYSTRL